MSPENFKHDIITMNETNLDENLLSQIIHYLPSTDELNRLNELAKATPINEFHEAEKFAIIVMESHTHTLPSFQLIDCFSLSAWLRQRIGEPSQIDAFQNQIQGNAG